MTFYRKLSQRLGTAMSPCGTVVDTLATCTSDGSGRVDTGIRGAVVNVNALTADIDPSEVESMTGIRPSTWPEVAEKARRVRARVTAQYEPMSLEYQTMVTFCDAVTAFVESQMTGDRAQLSLPFEEVPIAA